MIVVFQFKSLFVVLEKKNLTSSGYSGTGSGSDGGPSDGESSTDSDIIDSDKYLKMLQNQVFKHKSYLKNCWSELRWALDLLYKVNDFCVYRSRILYLGTK